MLLLLLLMLLLLLLLVIPRAWVWLLSCRGGKEGSD